MVRHFLAWAAATYPLHAHGAHLVVDAERDAMIVHDLLARYGRDHLEQMAILCWTLEADADPTSHATWIAKSDRSLRVLRHKAAFLDRVVVGAQQLTLPPLVTFTARELEQAEQIRTRAWGGRCQHEDPCEDWRACVRAIALRRRSG